jgi:hypothetical protein
MVAVPAGPSVAVAVTPSPTKSIVCVPKTVPTIFPVSLIVIPLIAALPPEVDATFQVQPPPEPSAVKT